jgi:hypothetical protein
VLEARKNARRCAKCGAAIGPQEPVWVGTLVNCYQTPLHRRIVARTCKVPYCCNCYHGNGRRAAAYYDSPFQCVTCDRPVYLRVLPGNRHFIPYVIACSEDCRQAFYRARRLKRKGPRERVCAVCGETFTPPWRDAKTCSPACRQKAYRQRVTDARVKSNGINRIRNARPKEP